jgi:hypothetical protein
MEGGEMPTVNNIFNIKVLSVSSNGSLNFGSTLHKGHTANQKSVGGYSTIGDASLNRNSELNNVADPDFADQPTKQL